MQRGNIPARIDPEEGETMRVVIAGLVAALVVGATPAEQFRSLVREYQEGRDASIKALTRAKTAAERQAANERAPQAQAVAASAAELVRSNPKEPVAFDVAEWLLANRPSGPEIDEVLERIAAEQVDSERVESLLPGLAATRSEAADALCR